jgi:AcrR family transcriptional regulator
VTTRSVRRVGRPPGPQPDQQERRLALLEAAKRAIRAHGPHVSMDDLASEAGVTKPILYSHFGDKAGLATALAEHYVGDLTPSVLAAFDGTRPPKEMVREAIDTFIAFVEADVDVYRFLVRGVTVADLSFIEQRLVAGFGRQVAVVMAAALGASDADVRPAEMWSFALLGTVLAGAEWWVARNDDSMSRTELVDHLTSLVWGGLAGAGIERLDIAELDRRRP